ncbi:MAG: DNA repair exonuclease [Candidatus Latescibacteria bacterium]|nr:DNA repair exonuclease [Candidatus Latescibacterota bacterium]NIM22035.1 DNA repair exonuclease [Candidatus Latescibacterota bacterium]NIM66053.1 DNA repair exonuclease [Candidatus Latescibacterota bacterium]NIO02461.1 DNA repair exonuclease [Candidatus Latescibacterota bacterium]NIO29372.1 DNA repair exonuclease [Candidatus Latescibacterota bacterium]
MRILHTADIHLKEPSDERWAAFETIVGIAGKSDASVLVISGDMFDRNAAADRLKTAIRDVFRQNPFHVVIIPGNHDDRALKSGDYLGEKVTVLDESGRFVDIDRARIIGLPFEKIGEQQVIERLFGVRQHIRPGGVNILLYHGELSDKFFDREGYGGEDEYHYMPARLSHFDGLGLDYVLAGHFHTKFHLFKFRDGYFVYPGSPVSITKRETGRRSIDFFAVGDPPKAEPLDTHHFETIEVRLNPVETGNAIETIKSRISSCHEAAKVSLTISGHVDLESIGMSRKQFGNAIDTLKRPNIAQIDHEWRDVGEILQNDIYKRFADHLEKTQLSEERKTAIRDLALEAFSEVAHAD